MNVSVVVPTFARSGSLVGTIATLVASSREGFDNLEVVVVDDGSPVAVTPLVDAIRAKTTIPLVAIRQPNSGPAAARNRGFRAARGELVLFVDDDIEVPPGLVSAHVAAHRSHPDSVVFGRCVLPDDVEDRMLRSVLERLGGDPGANAAAEFEPCDTVASGQLSVPRRLFDTRAGVYREDLRTPAAEEFELSARLHRLGIPLLRANRITAIHRTELTLDWVCMGQFNHGKGCAEAAAKAPETLALSALRRVIERHDIGRQAPLDLLGTVVSSHAGRRVLLQAARIFRTVLGRRRAVAQLYRWAIAAHFVAGVREGWGEVRGQPE